MLPIIKKAFTLIELLVVIAIIGILSGLIVVSMSGVTDKANLAKIQVFSNSLRNSLMSNIIDQYTFDDITDYNATTKVLNSTAGNVPNSWNGTGCRAYGGPTLKEGSDCVFGKCLYFDGTDDYINCPSSISHFSSNFTIGVWANSLSKSWHYIMGNGRYNMSNAFEIVERQSSYGYAVYYDTTGTDPKIIQSNSLAPGKWKYITVTHDGAVIKIYIDGVYKNQMARVGNFTDSSFIIGDDGISGRYWYGYLDELRMYDAVMSISQIQEQYYLGLGKLLASGGLTKEEYRNQINDFKLASAN